MPPKNFQFYWMRHAGLCARWPLVSTVTTAPRIHRVGHRCRRLRRLRHSHPTGGQSPCVIRPTRSVPIRCENRFGQSQCVIRRTPTIPIRSESRLGQTQCVIRRTRRIPILCEIRLPTGRRRPPHSRESRFGRDVAHGGFEQASGLSINGMSASRRGGLRSRQHAGGRTLAQASQRNRKHFAATHVPTGGSLELEPPAAVVAPPS